MEIASLTRVMESDGSFTPSSRELISAFTLFTKASEALEGVHGRLLQQIEYLTQELETTNLRLRQSLRETEVMRNELLHIIESQPNGVLVIRHSGEIIHCNRKAKELLDSKPHQPVGIPTDPILTNPYSSFFRSCLESPEQERVEALTLADPSGKELRHIIISASPLRDMAQQIVGTIMVINDNTNLKRLEEESNRHEKLAAMGSMAAQLAHEIRNPLSSIGLYASLIHECLNETDPSRKWCRQIEVAVNTLNTLVTNMLHLARPTPPVLEALDLHGVLKVVLEFALPLLEANCIILGTCWRAPDSLVLGNPESLRQMMLNLLLNAIQAMPEGGSVQVETFQSAVGEPKDGITLRIADTGVGIDPEVLPRLFEPGFSQRKGGNGLGLWIVGQIVKNHHGSIKVHSDRGKGTEFLISFPGGYAKNNSNRSMERSVQAQPKGISMLVPFGDVV